MRTLSKLVLTASVSLALATFSCSSGVEPTPDPSSSSTIGSVSSSSSEGGVSSSSISSGVSSSSMGLGVSSSSVVTEVSSSSVGLGVSSSSVGLEVSSSSIGTEVSSSSVSTGVSSSSVGSEVSSSSVGSGVSSSSVGSEVSSSSVSLGVSSSSSKWEFEYAIGDIGPGGGKIFYRSETGFTVEGYSSTGASASRGYESYIAHYLEVAPENFTMKRVWSPNSAEISGVTTFTDTLDVLASKIGDGRRNTWLITEYLNSINGDGAAKDCYNSTAGGKNDWFLPSFKELSELYHRRTLLGDNSSDDFWSSSQYNDNYAWRHYFGFGARGYSNKATTSISTRAVRAF